MTPKNLFSDIPAELAEEAIHVLVESHGVRIERIVSRGHITAPGSWYDQDRAEWVMVVKGQARIAFEDRPEPVALGPGEHLVIPARVRHRVVHTDPDQDTIWLAVHFP
ncbi:MAG: cupin domain-containing protein [Desulfobacterales bacterium]|nr:cupin domain-containing protein [Desulfobacterales bacterium]